VGSEIMVGPYLNDDIIFEGIQGDKKGGVFGMV
jgi:hypothetical protein